MSRSRITVLCLLVFFQVGCILFPSQSVAEALKLTTVNWQPFYGEDIPNKGFFSAIAREAFKRAGYDIQIDFQPWKRALESTRQGKYDGLLGIYYTKSRSDYLTYSDPVIETRDVFIARDKQLVNYRELQELTAMSVAAVRGSLYAEQLNESGFTVVETNDDLQALRMLLRERVGLAITGERHFKHLLSIHPELQQAKDALVILSKPFSSNPLYVPILTSRENSQQIIHAFNKALAEMKQDGSISSILQEAGY